MNESRAVVAYGSNLGDREATILEAFRLLAAVDGVELVAVSDPIESVAVKLDGDDLDAPRYLNGVALLDTSLEPEALLAAINTIEEQLGRVRVERWGDRTIDLDIIIFGDVVLNTPRLTIPHPRAAERNFVLEPWLTLDPAAVIPGRGSVRDLAARVSS